MNQNVQNRNVSTFCDDSLTSFPILLPWQHCIGVESISHRNSNSIIRSFPSLNVNVLLHWTEKNHFILWNFFFQWKIVCCTFNMLMIQSDFLYGFCNNKNGMSLTTHDHVSCILDIKCKIEMDFYCQYANKRQRCWDCRRHHHYQMLLSTAVALRNNIILIRMMNNYLMHEWVCEFRMNI